MASLICVLCFIKLENKSDVNLVKGKRAIDISAEIEDLDFVVQPGFKSYLPTVYEFDHSKDKSSKKNLINLNTKLLNDYLNKARANGIAVKMKHSAKRVPSPDELGASVSYKSKSNDTVVSIKIQWKSQTCNRIFSRRFIFLWKK